MGVRRETRPGYPVATTVAALNAEITGAPVASTDDVSTQTVTDVPALLKPTTPRPTRFPTGSKMVTAFQSGHSWAILSSGTGSTGTVADDTTNFLEGSQSLALTTSGTASSWTTAVSPVLSPTLDLTKNSLVLKFRVAVWANLSGAFLMVSNDAGNNLPTTRAQVAIGSAASLLASDGEFVWVGVNPGDFATAGGFSAVNMAAVSRVAIAMQQQASACQINLQQLWTRPAPTTPCTVITFDDGYLTQYAQAKPYMDKYGFKGVLFPIRDLITGSGTYMSTAQLQALYDNGWDIGCHSDTGAAHNATNALVDSSISDGTATALSSFERELVNNKKWLIANGWTRGAEFFAWPQGKFDYARQQIARKYFALIRVYRPALTVSDCDTYPFVDGGKLRQIAVQSGGSPTAAATVTAALTAAWAAGKTVVLTFHGLGSVQGYEYPVASFQTIIDHIEASGYPVKTLSAIMRDNGTDAPVGKADVAAKLNIPTGTPDGTKYARDDGTWVTPGAALPSQTGNAGKVLSTDGSSASWQPSGSGGVAAQLFTANGTYTAPATGLYRVSAVGGGGGGGGGGAAALTGGVTTQAAGAGGGSGEFVESVVSLTAAGTLAVTIGTGGAGGTGGTASTDGTGHAAGAAGAGVSTTVVGTATLTARGGSAPSTAGANTNTTPNPGLYGPGGSTTAPGHAGDGGQTTTSSGFAGGAGVGLVSRGGGGGTPANATNGGNGSTGSFSSGHTGTAAGGNGSAVTANTGAGGNGGGGGAPGGAGGNGSDGATGQVLIERIS